MLTRGTILIALLVVTVDARAQCSSDTDCKGDRICQDGKCVSRAPCTKDTDCKGDRICQGEKCVSPGSPPPAAPAPAQSPAAPSPAPITVAPVAPVGGPVTVQQQGGDPGWAGTAGTLGIVSGAVILGLAIGAELNRKDNEISLPLGGTATLICGVMGPVVYAGGGSARSRSGVPGVPATRIAGWVSYGLGLTLALVAIGLGAAEEQIPEGVTVGIGILGLGAMTFFTVDAFVARSQALRQRSTAGGAPRFVILPSTWPSLDREARIVGVGGRF